MTWTKFQLSLGCLMVISGSINTLATKWADDLESCGRDGVCRKFNHAFFQTLTMFFAECLCYIAFSIIHQVLRRRKDGSEDTNKFTKGCRKFNPVIFLTPALCDMVSTSLLYVGLNLTYVSSFLMLRGSVIVFVGLLSRTFLGKILRKPEWIGIILITVGLTVVGSSDFISSSTTQTKYDTYGLIIGDFMIILAQIIAAAQMVIEEKYVSTLNIPALEAVGWEGIFGFSVLSACLIPFYFIRVGAFSSNPRGVIEDVFDALVQMGNNFKLVIAISGMFFSLAIFNFAGVTVTKEFSATTRMVLDSIRTIVVWIVSLLFMGQSFQYLQLIGFMVLLIGMCVYNKIISCFDSKTSNANEPKKIELNYLHLSNNHTEKRK